MRIDEILRLVLINIKQNKGKVLLTSLGIIIGAATIVMVIAIGEGGKQDVAKQFNTLNAGTITIQSGSNTMGMQGMKGPGASGTSMAAMQQMKQQKSGGSNRTQGSSLPIRTSTLEQKTVEDLLYFVPDVQTGAIAAITKASAMGGIVEEAIEYDIVGTESSYQQISNLQPLVGAFLTEEELANSSRTVVLGYDVAVELFENPLTAYDSKIEMDGRVYIVNGVLQQMGTVVSGINPDSSIFMPYSTAEKYLFGRDIQPQISLLASDVDAVSRIIENTELVLKQEFTDATFQITDAGATMDAAMQSAQTLSMLLLAVAVIVFVVGGIGIMNVLFVSVKERTREIGILKALGMQKFNIMLLFLVEASFIGVFGGIVGVLSSLAVMPVMGSVGITVVCTVPAIVLAIVFAVVTGTVFGVYPAYKAASLVPVEALNNE